MDGKTFHSVTLNSEACKGCINCMKKCPTEAIRVRGGKATIMTERCIDCGECIRICTNRAKKAVTDKFSDISDYKWKIAMPAPSFYGQFDNIDDINIILTGLKKIGFDDIYEVSRAAEITTLLSRDTFSSLRESINGPIISSACPAVVRLIKTRFPALCENVLPVNEPVHIAAQLAKREASEKLGLDPSEIGVFFISPCPAKVTSAKSPIGVDRSYIDGVLSATDVYRRMLSAMKTIDEPENLMHSGIVGINWANSGGEAAGLLIDNYISADGIENVIKVLEEVEDDKLDNVDFIELCACPGGCVGGVLNIANAYVARARIKTLRKYLPLTKSKLGEGDNSYMFWQGNLQYQAIYKLDDDLGQAMEKMKKIDQIADKLPGLDCGSCGAPTCHAFAEDVIRGAASEHDCIIRFREELGVLARSGGLSAMIPVPFRERSDDVREED